MAQYRRISFEERVRISSYLRLGWSYGAISAELDRAKSTISREVQRCSALIYVPESAQTLASQRASEHNVGRKIDKNARLRKYIFQKLAKRWSPEQISLELERKFPDNQKMQISSESIYTYLYLLPRGALKKELLGYLRQKKRIRGKRSGTNEKRGKIPEMISIEERPKEVADRSVPGHWEGDLIIGKNHKSAVGTIVERKTRTVILVPLKAKDAESVRKAFEIEFKKVPNQLKHSMTYDQGHEMSQHKLFTKNTKVKVFFCHPASPWERGTCENTNMLIRDYFPKGTDFNTISRRELKRVQRELNERPRKTLGFITPIEAFNNEIMKSLR